MILFVVLLLNVWVENSIKVYTLVGYYYRKLVDLTK